MGIIDMILGKDVVRDIALSVRASAPPGSWSQSSIAKYGTGSNGYYSTDQNRVLAQFIASPSGTANSMLNLSLHDLSRQLRQLERNNATVRAIVAGHRADLVGTGITIDPQTGDDVLNREILAVWDEQRAHIGAAGESDMELQRMWVGELDCAGNALGRFVMIPDRVDAGLLPVAIQPFSVEWLSPEPIRKIPQGNRFAAGIEYDKYGRPVFYHLIHPESGKTELVSSKTILHAFERKQPGQAVGEPRLCSIIERALQRGRLIDVELQSAINASAWTTALMSDSEGLLVEEDEQDAAGNYISEVPPGAHINLSPGDKLEMLKTERPNLDVPEFAGKINGDIAAAGEASRIWLDRDGSAYNFANSKFDQIRTNMLVKPTQKWFAPVCASLPYELSLPQIFVRLGKRWPNEIREQRKLSKHRTQPDVPPELDEKATQEALRSGLENNSTNLRDYYSSRGKNWRDELAQIAEEKAYMESLGIAKSDVLESKNV